MVPDIRRIWTLDEHLAYSRMFLSFTHKNPRETHDEEETDGLELGLRLG